MSSAPDHPARVGSGNPPEQVVPPILEPEGAMPAPDSFEGLLAVAPHAWLAVAIDSRMTATLRACVTPEDLAQDVLLSFWQARDRFEWRGPRSLRSYLLTLADRAIAGAADHHFAQKRGRGELPGALHSSVAGNHTAPSRAAQRDERVAIMRAALAALPDEVRECVRLRLFEEAPLKAIAAALSLPESTVRRRLRVGSELYLAGLREALATRTAPQGRSELSIDSLSAALPGLNSHAS